MSVLTEHRFSVKEYYRMAETGVLRPDARVELLNGKIIDMSPIGPFHGDVTTYLTEFFAVAAKRRWRTRVQNSVRLDDIPNRSPIWSWQSRSPTASVIRNQRRSIY